MNLTIASRSAIPSYLTAVARFALVSVFVIFCSMPAFAFATPATESESTGFFHAVASKSDGTIWTWRTYLNGELGNGTTANYTTTFTAAATGDTSNVVHASAASVFVNWNRYNHKKYRNR
ncbi:MAG: hypothetical protein WC378_13730 [Opitutaceae bacterium]